MTVIAGLDTETLEFIDVERDGGVVIVTLNRPERRNAVSHPIHRGLVDLFIALGRDYDSHAVVITGAGKAFCAGGDLKAMAEEDVDAFGGEAKVSPLLVEQAEARKLLNALAEIEQPIVAAVNGDAYGLGASIALGADIIIYAEDARIADTHVRAGIVAGDGGAVYWPLALGPYRAKEFLMRSIPLTGVQAVEYGMGNYAVPREEVMPKALEIAHELASGPPLATRWTKLAVNRHVKSAIADAFDVGIALEMITRDTDDHRSAVRSFLDGSEPVFKGR